MLLWFVPIALTIILQAALWFSSGGLLNIMSLSLSQHKAEAAVLAMRAKNSDLVADIADLRTGQEVLELNARNQLGMIKRGEVFYRIVTRG
jgi:cell division protein FtsB